MTIEHDSLTAEPFADHRRPGVVLRRARRLHGAPLFLGQVIEPKG